ncbi:hypothetical protein BAUCODRAFT_23830 [Baudoinia panamericana UAMH 10762]|uniref:Uncharacterized protein n=1 Tax=Baudoinia panamericana (strain UAMH 10762) TaxID=717646 RepID=M2MLN3_BAUPA|nr:uncharacterized protein BAUCODRAFT_23830 [Baudoinia panamericana UAMH 10762]EMC97561.1 hypothetical protein BAUCODRAFT_23830 [Baudoinia panamericana UAMH 10762]
MHAFTTTTFIAALAAAANAYELYPRQNNGSLTTATVFATTTYTVISCAPTVTDCPAHPESQIALTVTDIISVATTVCPVEQASSATSVILASFSATASSTPDPSVSYSPTSFSYAPSDSSSSPSIPSSFYYAPSGSLPSSSAVNAPVGTGALPSSSPIVAPLSTGYSTPSSSSAVAALGTGFVPAASPNVTSSSTITIPTTHVDNTTLTYVLGTGSSSSTITTTIHSTRTQYLTSTLYLTSTAAAAVSTASSGVSSSIASNDGPASGLSQGATTAGTSTIHSTRTITNFITVYPVAASSTPASAGSGAKNTAAAGADGSCVINTVTVTEKETIFVTIGGGSSTSTGATVQPIQSSPAAYYPTSGYPSSSGIAGASSSRAATGFVTAVSPSASAYSATIARI